MHKQAFDLCVTVYVSCVHVCALLLCVYVHVCALLLCVYVHVCTCTATIKGGVNPFRKSAGINELVSLPMYRLYLSAIQIILVLTEL